ncbi:Methyltransferase [Candidatus Desulfarcum epimagneticum]|uniref:Methyltransferase n=1 Tax=uncultured Desulfobacteraceae bacterium TaxID=218296 RepID=A0A484HEW7_9BACT|nr:Methyltransferase [uncultured Desulfobacteraceae bacterium]
MSASCEALHVNQRGEYVNFGIQWLLDHHRSKERQRRKMVRDLNLRPGDTVLDLGCGPGLWTSLISEKVKPEGRVVGVDSDPEFLEYASRRLSQERFEGIVDLHEGDFYSVPFEDNSFDVVFFGNCFAYVTDHQKVLDEQIRVTRKGGRIAVKDFEGSVLVIHPIPPSLTLNVVTAAAKALQNNPPEPPFDNFSGQKLRGLLVKAGLRNVSATSYAVHMLPPLTPEAKQYISGNAAWYADIGKPYLSDTEFEQWRAYFDVDSPSYILDSEEFYFCMLEVLATGYV